MHTLTPALSRNPRVTARGGAEALPPGLDPGAAARIAAG